LFKNALIRMAAALIFGNVKQFEYSGSRQVEAAMTSVSSRGSNQRP